MTVESGRVSWILWHVNMFCDWVSNVCFCHHFTSKNESSGVGGSCRMNGFIYIWQRPMDLPTDVCSASQTKWWRFCGSKASQEPTASCKGQKLGRGFGRAKQWFNKEFMIPTCDYVVISRWSDVLSFSFSFAHGKLNGPLRKAMCCQPTWRRVLTKRWAKRSSPMWSWGIPRCAGVCRVLELVGLLS